MFLRIDITKNLKYDRYTNLIIKSLVKNGDNCIDIGCHKGEILSIFLKQSPIGQHYAFEPIPSFYDNLLKNFKNVHIYPYALAASDGQTTFNYVKNAPAYSGLQKRSYAVQPEIELLEITKKTLDSLIPSNQKIDFIKIDVEGGEFEVLKGAIALLKNQKPKILFEFGLGASDYYNIKPKDMYELICHEIGLKIYTLDNYNKADKYLTFEAFNDLYYKHGEYYFFAA